MIGTNASISRGPIVTPEFLHREAAVQLEKAVKHHRQAALLHEAGDSQQAETYASMAYKQTSQALQASDRALNVQLW